ncbi:D-arabinono-1,4-lactone oxidase [Corynebacterium aurimucosum]|uniref:Putative FAD/FMN-containing dehydrogenase n=1 Tax=Corynebacterium aurimucosum (strain ATCC 700975 / DSM 44827 / CIP 107346 / CN-1) TaxID=548476 RepID=C3PFE7_CORA7|nr:D-arabinono-1,4-lactone oxidase [Corynebacterium aurimucosum]ACP32551.1 putative FAD/FMN-containing dehydrogenase [Corynebacterium aurimucosum ATCC 700975]QQU93273.1 FAD-binding protein [Corynebacterium aurimucosum]
MTTTFSNWAGSVTTKPQELVQPSRIDEIPGIISRSRSVRAVGAGHSFTPIAAGEETMLNLDHVSGLVSVDKQRKRVRFLAGTRLRDVPALLRPFGLALANQGDVDPQSLAGAISTSTHGTGINYTGFAGTVTGLTLIDADGNTRTYSIDEDPELLRLVVVSVGALGVVVEVEMQCVDAFDLLAEESGIAFDELMDNWEELSRDVDHFESYWFPHTDRAMVKANTRLEPNGERRSRLKALIDDELIGNGAFAAALTLGRLIPGTIPMLNKFATSVISHNRYRSAAHDVFVSPRRVRFHEMEYAVPLADGPATVREIRRFIDEQDWRIGFPMELRTTAADDVALSTASGRESMYIAFHIPRALNPQDYMPKLEPIFRAAGGRPHWGKMNSLSRNDFAQLYTRFDEFCQLRENMDPEWKFGSPYLRKLFG